MPVLIRARRIRFLPAQPGDGLRPAKSPPCEYCGRSGHPFAPAWGCHIGSSGMLRDSILEGRDAETHPWYTGRWSISAHHLICSEAMADDEDWARYCRQFGYDINHWRNGVILPSRMGTACELRVPVHRGNHVEGWAYDINLAYPKAVMAKLKHVAEQVERGSFCADIGKLVRRLNKVSAEILSRVARFTWTLSSDGLDYREGGVGCAGVTSIQDKPQRECPHQRAHGSRHGVTGQPLSRHALRIGR